MRNARFSYTATAPLVHSLEVEHLSVTLEGVPVLRNLSFAVPQGSTLAVIGPNGAGKTVLLRALIGVLPYGGTVRWARGTRLGYVPQKLDLERALPLSGIDLLRAKAEVCRTSDRDVSAAFDLVELPLTTARRTIGRMSGGEFQRVLLAFALMGEPTVLLFDEPTAGLDEPGVRAVYALLTKLERERGMTIILVSHELSIVYAQAQRVLCLSHGTTYFGAPQEVLTTEHLSDIYGQPVQLHSDADHAERGGHA